MKKITILIAALAFGMNAFAARPMKADTGKSVKKPVQKSEYKPDPDKVYHIVLDLTDYQVYSLTGTSDGSIHRSPKLTGAQIGELEDEAKDIRKEIFRQEADQAAAAYKAWQADTAAKEKPPLKPLKQ